MSDKPTINLTIYPDALDAIKAGAVQSFEFPEVVVVVSVVNVAREQV